MKQLLFPLKPDPLATDAKKWEAMDPLTFAQYLARQATKSQPCAPVTSNLAQRRGIPPLQINMELLAKELPPVPTSPHHASEVAGSIPSSIVAKVMTGIKGSPEPILVTTHTGNHGSRKRPVAEVTPPTLVPFDEDFEDKYTTALEPYFLHLRNLNEERSTNLVVSELHELDKRFKCMPKYADCMSSYQRFLTELSRSAQHISHSDDSLEEKNKKFCQLYFNALKHIKSLMEMAENLQQQHAVEDQARTLEHLTRYGAGSQQENLMPDHTHSTVAKKTYNKKDFTCTMNQWLVDNWTNPYPDDEGISALADRNGTTPTIVSNWLINARTRKWRPAIVKAYETGRPADMLKEDSIRIFQRKPLRKL
jgi:hypothetical protein